jgi:outer membrane protein assembly factor BamB
VHRDDGRLLWTATLPASGREYALTHAIGLHGYASHTPAVDDAGVYVFYGASGAAAYSHDGKLRWQRDCGHGNHDWGSASSVVLAERLVVLTAGIESGNIVALDKASGREVWRRPMGESSRWTTPAVAKVKGVEELVFAFEGAATGIDAKTGKTLWTCGCYAWGTPKPLVHDGVVYLTGEARMAAIRLGGRGDVTRTHKLWEVDGGSRCASAVYHDGYLYLVRSEQDIVCCVNANTGRTEYRERLAPASGIIYASPLLAEGRVYYVSRGGGVYVVAAAPRFRLLAHNTIQGDASLFNGSPIVSRGRIVLRSDRFLYCISESK